MNLVARETVIAVEGLATRMEDWNNARVADTLSAPVRELAASALAVLVPDATIEGQPTSRVERQRGIARGWTERATFLARSPWRPVQEARLTVDYDFDNPREDGWSLEVAFPTLTLEGDPYRLVSFRSQFNMGGRLRLLTQRASQDLVARLVEVTGPAFGGGAKVVEERGREGRPPDHPSRWSRVEVPRFTETYAEVSLPTLQERLRDPVAALARGVLAALAGGSVTIEPWVREETPHPRGTSVSYDARARSTAGPSLAARIGYSPLRFANVNVELALDDYRPDWHPLARVLLTYDTRGSRIRHEPDTFGLLVGDAFPAEWKPAIVAAIGEAFGSPATVVSERREVFGARPVEPGAR